MSKSRAWFITWNNYTPEQLQSWKDLLTEKCDQWAWQLEEGQESKTPHIQGAIYFKSQRSFSAVKKDLPFCHIEVQKSWTACAKYCQKVTTRIQGGSADADIKLNTKDPKDEKPPLKDPMEGLIKKPWQIKIDEMILEIPDNRKIYWFYDINGATGKTTYAKHLSIRNPTKFLYLGGKASDIKSAIHQMDKVGNAPTICVFDYTRSTEDFVSYEALESVKNGIFFSGKYEPGMVSYEPPHVIIFANFSPQLSKLSQDRWVVEDITEIA